MKIIFFIQGLAKPAGSKRAFVMQRAGQKARAIVVDACKTSRDWKTDVKYVAAANYIGELLTQPIKFTCTFTMPRPNGHYRTGKNKESLRPSSPNYHTIRPDVLKLARAVEDALTGVIWKDDAQIVLEVLAKHYGPTPGCLIEIETLP